MQELDAFDETIVCALVPCAACISADSSSLHRTTALRKKMAFNRQPERGLDDPELLAVEPGNHSWVYEEGGHDGELPAPLPGPVVASRSAAEGDEEPFAPNIPRRRGAAAADVEETALDARASYRPFGQERCGCGAILTRGSRVTRSRVSSSAAAASPMQIPGRRRGHVGGHAVAVHRQLVVTLAGQRVWPPLLFIPSMTTRVVHRPRAML